MSKSKNLSLHQHIYKGIYLDEMPCFEGPRLCTVEEYDLYINNRLTPDKLVVGEDFNFLGTLYPWARKGDAFVSPVRCERTPKQLQVTGLWIVELTVLDDDMDPFDQPVSVPFYHDGMLALTKPFCEEDPYVKSGYLKNYDDGISSELLSFVQNSA